MSENTTEPKPVDTLAFSEFQFTCYKFNRLNAPDLTPYQWRFSFPNWQELEQKYQEENKVNA